MKTETMSIPLTTFSTGLFGEPVVVKLTYMYSSYRLSRHPRPFSCSIKPRSMNLASLINRARTGLPWISTSPEVALKDLLSISFFKDWTWSRRRSFSALLLYYGYFKLAQAVIVTFFVSPTSSPFLNHFRHTFIAYFRILPLSRSRRLSGFMLSANHHFDHASRFQYLPLCPCILHIACITIYLQVAQRKDLSS